MQRRRLGQTVLEVSVIGLGTVKFGRNEGVKYPQAFTLPSDSDIEQMLLLAEELGINLLDTAPAYGSSEARLGKLLGYKRHDWIISTKAGEQFVDGKSYYDFSEQAITKSVENSLRLLKTDYLDILLIHSNGADEDIIEKDKVFATLHTLKASGKIRAFGMSTKTVKGGLLTVDYADLAMVTLNPLADDEIEVIKAAHVHQKGIFIKKAFASGHLEAEACLRFILQASGVTSVIVGTINPKHLRENVAAALKYVEA